MYKLHTKKQLKYFDKVIRLHNEEGYGCDRIANIFPVSSNTVSRWIAIFAANSSKSEKFMKQKELPQPLEDKTVLTSESDLQARIKELESKLRDAEIRAEAYDEMINVAENMFHINIRKKAGAKQ